MPAKHTLHVALTEPLIAYVAGQVADGHFATASEVIRNALRLMIDKKAGTLKKPASDAVPKAFK